MYFEIENSIIEKAAEGDVGCFEKIVLLYEKTIYNVCYRFFNNAEDAQDVAQEVFIKIFRNLTKYNFSCKFSTWAHRIAVNSCIDYARKRKSEPSTAPLEETYFGQNDVSPVDAVISKDTLKNVGEAISRLGVEYKTVVVLRDVLGFSYNEISEITGANPGTVKSRISRARTSLKHILLNDFKIDDFRENPRPTLDEPKEVAK